MIPQNAAPILVMNSNTRRETGRKAQRSNIEAAKSISQIVTTTLGPQSMLKMLIDPMGGIVMTNDGNAILREIDTKHPAAKAIIELARAQDEEVGDGTTSVIVLAGELMQAAEPFINRNLHPTVIVRAYYMALEQILKNLEEMAVPIDINDDADAKKALTSCVGTKFAARWGDLVVNLALNSCRTIMKGLKDTRKLNLEIKRFAKVEKIPGGMLEDCQVFDGVMLNKDVTHPGMRRHIKNPRVLLLDCPLEYKKGESQTNLEMYKESDMKEALQAEVNEVAVLCNHILKAKPDVVITEKGVSDIAQHFLMKGNCTVIRRVRKTDNNRIARVTGATIVNRPEEITEEDIGKNCGTYKVEKIGDEYFTYFVDCKEPTACTILLRGGSKDSLNEMERNLHDALGVARNIFADARLLPGGGATELELAHRLNQYSKQIEGLEKDAFKAAAYSLEAIPRTLAQNCGAEVVRVLTELRAKHAIEGGLNYGVDGNKGVAADMSELNVWEPLLVKSQVIKTALESCCMLLRIDDHVSGIKRANGPAGNGLAQGGNAEAAETFGDARDG